VAGWEDIREFTLGNISRPATRTHNRIEFGPNAIRAVQGPNDDRVLEPYAYVGPNRSLYLDADLISAAWLDRRLPFAHTLLAK
jgi:hypothetical protein